VSAVNHPLQPLATSAVLALLYWTPGWIDAQSAAGQLQPSFRTGIDVVSLNVTVTDPDGRYVTDLSPEEFDVFEEGIRQEIKYFDRSNLPIALSLLVDTSASMEEKLSVAQEAAVGFARRTRPEDLAEVVDFDTRVTVVQEFTNKIGDLERAIRSTSVGGSTALYNAVYIALKELRRIRPAGAADLRRQAIVLLSDGDDTSSLVTFDEALDLAKRSETVIYAIGLRSATEPAGKGFREADFVLRELTQQTGGRVFFSTRAEELSGVYGQIGDELSSQYLIGYVSKNLRRDGAWRKIVVQSARPGVRARTKTGYYAPSTK